jgi:DNA-directed RNA polymerase subunit RPC12/RpoP
VIDEIKQKINKKVNDYFWKQDCQNEKVFTDIKKIYNGVLDKYNNQPECTLDEEEMSYGEFAFVCSNCGETHQFMSGTPEENNYNYCCNCGTKIKNITYAGDKEI